MMKNNKRTLSIIIVTLVVLISAIGGAVLYKYHREAEERKQLQLFEKKLDKANTEFEEAVKELDQDTESATTEEPEKATTRDAGVFEKLFASDDVVYINDDEYASNDMTGEEVEITSVKKYTPSKTEESVADTDQVLAVELSMNTLPGNPGQEITADDFGLYFNDTWYKKYPKNNTFKQTFDEKKSAKQTIYFVVPKGETFLNVAFISYTEGLGVYNDSFTIPYSFALSDVPQ